MSLTNIADLRLKTAEKRAKIGEKPVKTPVNIFNANSYCEKQKQKYIASILGGPANPALANVKMPGKIGIERIRQMMKEVNHPDLEKILKIEQKEHEAKNLVEDRKNFTPEAQITTVTPVYHF
ncbi:unnamed protein product [Oikopleura dioica]|uniref:Uncharacterized protein n=1 Tax=Oikopleura dioica TaxID=34765 RepID=E4Y8P5_OIKDI|nr:unnamed protein product [Oikopleura dioica]